MKSCRATRSVIRFLHRAVLSMVSSVILLSVTGTGLHAALPNPLDYFSYTYKIAISQEFVADGQIFFAEIEGTATCIKDAPVNPDEAFIKGRVIAQNLETGQRVALNSGYSTTVSPVPSTEGEVITATQELPLYFPWDAHPGKYHVTGELLEARFKSGGLWFDATDAFPKTQEMGYAYYKIPEPEPDPPPPVTTTVPPVSPTQPPGGPEPAGPTVITPPPPATTTTPPTQPTQPPGEPDPTGPQVPTQPSTPPAPTDEAPKEPAQVIPPGATGLAGTTGTGGLVFQTVTIASSDNLAKVELAAGTSVRSPKGEIPGWLMFSPKQNTPVTEGETLLIGQAYEISPEAVFDPYAVMEIEYYEAMLPSGLNPSRLVIARWDETASAWVALQDSRLEQSSNTVKGRVHQSGIYAIIGPLSPPSFKLENFDITPFNAASGEMVTIQCRVTNTGSVSGYYELVLRLNGEIQEVRRVNLAGGASRVVSFGVIRHSSGSYEVNVNGLTGVYNVTSQQHSATYVPDQTPGSYPEKRVFYWFWVVYGFNATLLLVILLLSRKWLYRKFIQRKNIQPDNLE